jgi:hypothetical protein
MHNLNFPQHTPQKLQRGSTSSPSPETQVVMAEESPDQTLQGVKEYQYFQPDLIKLIASENIYDEDENGGGHPPWEIDELISWLLYILFNHAHY